MEYYVNTNAQSDGYHEVHSQDCLYMPINKRYLGNYNSCTAAVIAASRIYTKADGCYYCCNSCHTR